MKTIYHCYAFNQRRYGAPWVAKLGTDGKPDFTHKIGGYTGEYRTGEEGDLYVTAPEENTVYMYGQKDYRGNGTLKEYAIYSNGEFRKISRAEALKIVLR